MRFSNSVHYCSLWGFVFVLKLAKLSVGVRVSWALVPEDCCCLWVFM